VRLSPGNQPGTSTLTVIGEDVSAVMARDQKAVLHPGLNDSGIVSKIIARYARFGIRPQVAPAVIKQPPARDFNELQIESDLAYVRKLARRNGYVFDLVPDLAGPRAYWGPPQRLSVAQPALSVALGSGSNVDRLDFDFDALAPERFEGSIQDPRTGKVARVSVRQGTDVPLTRHSAWSSLGADVRTSRFAASGISTRAGLAQAAANATASARHAVTAEGELDTMRYGHVLMPYRPVGVRGAGGDYDGTYYVGSVTHLIQPGCYRQRFSLNREGTGARFPTVRP
jgi:phage protein D